MAPPNSRKQSGGIAKRLQQLMTTSPSKPREHFVGGTVLVVKVLGLNSLVDRFERGVMFDTLRALSQSIDAMVTSYGGGLHQSFHGGFTAFFQDTNQADVPGTHADRAALCAMRLQQMAVHAAINSANKNQPILCLKIGLASGSIMTGPLFEGAAPAMLGRVLDLAHAMADACDVHSLMVPRRTVEFFKTVDRHAMAGRQHTIQLRNETHPCEAISFDPFEREPNLRRMATDAMRTLASNERLEHRWPITTPATLPLVTNFGPAMPADVSLSGIALILPSPVPVGATIKIRFDPEGKAFGADLGRHAMTEIEGEVRVVVARPGGYLIGLKYQALESTKKDFLLTTLLATQKITQTVSAA